VTILIQFNLINPSTILLINISTFSLVMDFYYFATVILIMFLLCGSMKLQSLLMQLSSFI